MKRSAESDAAVTAEPYSKEAYRLRHNGQIIGFAMLLMNGRWIHTDTEDRRQGDSTYASQRDVAKTAALSMPYAPAGEMTPIFDFRDFCDRCDALLTSAEKSAGIRFGQCLCDGCAEDSRAANHPISPPR